MRKHKVRAVHDDDLVDLLESLGMRGAIEAGETKCCVCGGPVTMETLQALVPRDKAVAAVCAKPACLKQIESDIAESRHE